jgi:FAD/FMN-containing dehydrogenase
MSKVQALNIDNKLIEIAPEVVDQLRTEIQGDLILPDDNRYDAARKIWNDMIDRRPALIVQCQTINDIISAVKFSKKFQLIITLRGAGHNIAGKSLQDDAMLIDLSLMRKVNVDSASQTVMVEPGATLADLDKATQAFGLAVPVGINSTTGVAGLTLGGGFGWTSRKYGLTIDNLKSAQVVTVDGELVSCDNNTNTDLFWAICGGGGNFGIVTSFTFQAHPLGPEVWCGPVVFPLSEGKTVLKNYREFCRTTPDEITVWAVVRNAPPFPFISEDYHGKPVVILVGIYLGDIKEGEKKLAQLRNMGKSLGDGLAPAPFTGFEQAFDPMLTPGARNYWKSHYFKELSDDLLDTLLNYGAHLPSEASEIFIGQLGGAINRKSADATAYPHRDVEFAMNLHARWEDKTQDEHCRNWSREFYQATLPFATGGIYVNFISEGDEMVNNAYGKNYEKLALLKAKYDPENQLRTNQNIIPKE